MEPVSESPIILRRPIHYAVAGLICGFLGLGLAVAHMSSTPAQPANPRRGIGEKVVDQWKKAKDKILGKAPIAPAPPPAPAPVPWPSHDSLEWGASACGLAGLICGCVSWLKRERRRYTWAALIVGFSALAWQHLLIAVVVAIVLILVLAFLMFAA